MRHFKINWFFIILGIVLIVISISDLRTLVTGIQTTAIVTEAVVRPRTNRTGRPTGHYSVVRLYATHSDGEIAQLHTGVRSTEINFQIYRKNDKPSSWKNYIN